MDIVAYLDEARQQMDRVGKRIKDWSVFESGYEPDEPVMRDEAKTLVQEMVRFERTGLPDHQAVIGSRGSGKTLMLKYLQRTLPRHSDLNVLYVNCRHQNTSFKIFASLLEGKTTGFSLPVLYDRFLQRYKDRTVLVLDEVDLMSPKDRRREILYLLSRSEQPYMVVMLTNSPQVLGQLDAATRSSLQPVPLYFKNYDAEQIRRILEARARQGLRTWQPADLAEIAAMTTKLTSSDARVAIKTLKYRVALPSETMQACFERARRDVVVDMIMDLSDANLAILWAVATSQDGLARDVYERYCQFSKKHRIKAFSYVHFYANLSYLQSAGLVGLMSAKVNRAYTNKVLLTCESDTVAQIGRLRFDQA